MEMPAIVAMHEPSRKNANEPLVSESYPRLVQSRDARRSMRAT
jgi:hypothetical protein